MATMLPLQFHSPDAEESFFSKEDTSWPLTSHTASLSETVSATNQKDASVAGDDRQLIDKRGMRQVHRTKASTALDAYCYGTSNLSSWGWPNPMEVPHYYRRPIFQHLLHDFGPRVAKESEYADGRLDHTPSVSYRLRHSVLLNKLLQDSLLQGNYDQVAYLMTALSRFPERLPEQLWRIGLEILKECSPRMRPNILRFYSLMQMLCEPYQGELVLDMAFYILQTDKDLIQSYELLTSKLNSRYCVKDPLVKAYVGLFEYCLWKVHIDKNRPVNCRKSDESSDESELDDDIDVMEESSQMHFYAKRALENLKIITERSGNWDIFMLKYIEILDYHRSKEDAVKVLEKYRERNPENPNARRYLYWYLKKIKAEGRKCRGVLEEIVKLDPTSELAPELIKIWKEEGKETNIVKLLFERLDHASCKENMFDWKELSRMLKGARRQRSGVVWCLVENCWSTRKEWWPKYHFAGLSEDRNQESRNDKPVKYIKRVEKTLRSSADDIFSEASSDVDSSPKKRTRFR